MPFSPRPLNALRPQRAAQVATSQRSPVPAECGHGAASLREACRRGAGSVAEAQNHSWGYHRHRVAEVNLMEIILCPALPCQQYVQDPQAWQREVAREPEVSRPLGTPPNACRPALRIARREQIDAHTKRRLVILRASLPQRQAEKIDRLGVITADCLLARAGRRGRSPRTARPGLSRPG